MNAALKGGDRWGNQREHKREAVASGSYRPVEAGQGRWVARQSTETTSERRDRHAKATGTRRSLWK